MGPFHEIRRAAEVIVCMIEDGSPTAGPDALAGLAEMLIEHGDDCEMQYVIAEAIDAIEEAQCVRNTRREFIDGIIEPL